MILPRHERLRIALPNNVELEQICGHLRQAGFSSLPDMSRPGLYIVPAPFGADEDVEFREFEFFRLEPTDVSTYVEHGICHGGVVHTDLLREARARVWRPFTFSFGGYPLVLAAPQGQDLLHLTNRPVIRVATSLPELTKAIFTARGMGVEVVSVEDSLTACLLGLADGYVDRLTDPDFLVDQGFRVTEVVGQAHLKLIANRGCGVGRRRAIARLVELLEAHQPPPPEPLRIPFDEY